MREDGRGVIVNYLPVIGLEIHCELLTASKVFCSCANAFGGEPNTRVCPVCSGMPGTLPRLNRNAVRLAAKAGLALSCTVNNYSAFDRKNYFYPDLPKAYQITQFYRPICSDGSIRLSDGRDIRIERIHIEEDAGKLTHSGSVSLADYNRCGVPLIEIVTAPDLRSAEETQELVRKIALRLKYAGVCDGRMEQGSLRVDVNISLMREGSDVFGTRAELKNINSIRSIGRAIEYEIRRQSEILDGGGSVIQETRRFDEASGNTLSMRSKAEAHDYRYFPEPDIPPVYLTDEQIESFRAELPEMPASRLARYNAAGLSDDDAALLAASREMSDFYDAAVSVYPNHRRIAATLLVDVNYHINNSGKGISEVRFTPADIAELVRLTDEGVISKNAAKDVLEIMFYKGGAPADIIEKHSLAMTRDTGRTEEKVNEIINANPGSVEQYRAGNTKVIAFFMGQAMRSLGKGADPKLVREAILRRLEE